MENENITPVEPQIPVITPETKENRPMGALIGTIIIIFILVLGGIYLWNTKIQTKLMATTEEQATEQKIDNLAALEESSNTADTVVDQITNQSPSDTTASIEADLNATNISTLDKELQSI